MMSVGPHSTSGKEKEGIKGRTRWKDINVFFIRITTYRDMLIAMNIQGHPFGMSEKYNVIAIKLMNISLCNFL